MTDGTTREWTSDTDQVWGAAFAPNGRWVAYASDETGQFEIWVRSFPDGEIRRQVSVDFGIEPIWSERNR